MPGLIAAPLDKPAPAPLALLVKESGALAANRPLAREVQPEAPDSRALFALLPALMRQRGLPRIDEDSFERLLQTVGATLAASVKPFGEVLLQPTPRPAELELGAATEAGTICLTWHGDLLRPVGCAQLTMLWSLAAPIGKEPDRFAIGECTLPRAEVLCVRATLAAALHHRAMEGQRTPMPRISSAAPPASSREQFDGCLAAVRELLQLGSGVAAAPPRPHAESDGEVAPIVSEVEADADLAPLVPTPFMQSLLSHLPS